jgi:hypothetical protein
METVRCNHEPNFAELIQAMLRFEIEPNRRMHEQAPVIQLDYRHSRPHLSAEIPQRTLRDPDIGFKLTNH